MSNYIDSPKKCPFCGKIPTMVSINPCGTSPVQFESKSFIQCCFIETRINIGLDNLVRLWNRRVKDE